MGTLVLVTPRDSSFPVLAMTEQDGKFPQRDTDGKTTTDKGYNSPLFKLEK